MRARGLFRCALAALSACLAAPSARADEGIVLSYDAPPACASREDLLAQIAAFGGRFREAERGEEVRSYDVAIHRMGTAGPYHGALVVRDVGGDATSREATSARCDDVARSLALFVALALDTPPPPPPPRAAPSPLGDLGDAMGRGERPARPHGRLGSGGLVLTGTYGALFGVSSGETRGVSGYAAWLAGERIRLGIAFGAEEQSVRRTRSDSEMRASGYGGRVGLMFGWGAPWSDAIAGFVGQAGLVGGAATGSIAPGCPAGALPAFAGAGGAFSGSCYADSAATRATPWFVSPYASWSLVLQLPWKLPVRPIASATGALASYYGDVSFGFSGEIGAVWQAW